MDDISLVIPEERIVGLVGGSGSGKTTTGMAILRLLSAGLYIKNGSIHFQGRNLIDASETELQHLRGNDIAMIFQEPLHAFNPVFTIGYQIDEVLQIHTRMNEGEREKRVYELIETVGLPEPRRHAEKYDPQ